MASDESGGLSSELDSDERSIEEIEAAAISVDPSRGKDHKLFGTVTKNVTVLGKGISPSKLGKKTVSLFLEQIDDMTAYPRHSSHKNLESLGAFVDAVTDISNAR